jgi:hypothetical protein
MAEQTPVAASEQSPRRNVTGHNDQGPHATREVGPVDLDAIAPLVTEVVDVVREIRALHLAAPVAAHSFRPRSGRPAFRALACLSLDPFTTQRVPEKKRCQAQMGQNFSGAHAKFLLAVRPEDWWSVPLGEVRACDGIALPN